MSTFSDFGPLTERRRAELKQRQRKRMMTIGGSVFVVLVVVVAAVGAVAYTSSQGTHSKDSSKEPSNDSASTTQMHSVSKSLEVICSPTTYKDACQKSLSKVTNSTSSPKDMIRAAVSVIGDEVGKAFGQSKLIKSDNPRVKQAIEDCKEHFEFVKDDLAKTLDGIDMHNLDALPTRSKQLRMWLSAVVTFQETCIDGFPEGEFRTKMQEAMKSSKQLTSNALAIIGKVSSFLSSLDIKIPGINRRLLSEQKVAQPDIDKDGFPSWISKEDRRILKGKVKGDLKANVVVAKDGSGDFTTVNAAINAVPKSYKGRYVIHVKEGQYDEQVIIPSKMVNITMIGDGSQKSIITGSKNYIDGVSTYKTATVAVSGDGFMAIAMGFRNTAGAVKHQAVALRVQGDRSIFLNCRMEGYQDTLYAHSLAQFYRSCVIAGTIDFLFGDAAAVFQNCIFTVRRPLDNQQNIVTANGRTDPHESTGFVLQRCKIVADKKLIPDQQKIRSYLGRPWKEYSHTMIMESDIGGFINRDGFLPWNGDFALKTLTYREYNNKGPGADTSGRVRWPGYKVVKSRDEAFKYTVDPFLGSDNYKWIKATGTPIKSGLYM